jgi:hypothetical protein
VSESLTIVLHNRQQAWAEMQTRLHPFLKLALQADRKWVLTVRPETRSLEQNRRLWAMLNDVSEQVDWHGQKLTPEDWKHIFSASIKKQRAVPGLDGGFVVLGQSTSKMGKVEMSEMQELIEAFGAEHDVKFKAVE